MKQRWILFCISCVLIIFLYYFPRALTVIPRGVSSIAYPFLCIQKSIIKIFSSDKPSQSLYQLVNHLHKQNKKLLADNIALRGQLLLSAEIQDLVSFKQHYDDNNAILTQVLLKTLTSQEHSFVIDRGSYHGIQRDMVAVWHNCLIGKVIDVFPLYSKVLLITDARCKIAAQGELFGARGIIEGIQDVKVLSFSYVDHLSSIGNGEMIFSSGEGLIFPKGFLLGKVKTFQSGDLYHTIAIQPACALGEIDYCYVFLKGRPEAAV